MRFTLIKDLKKDDTMLHLLVGMLLFFFLYICADLVVKYYGFGLLKSQVILTLFGDEDAFMEGMLQSTFLEYIHQEIFFTMMLLLTLCAVYVRIMKHKIHRAFILHITMVTALLTPIFLVLAYFYTIAFVICYIAAFFIWHLSALFMVLISLQRLLFAKSI